MKSLGAESISWRHNGRAVVISYRQHQILRGKEDGHFKNKKKGAPSIAVAGCRKIRSNDIRWYTECHKDHSIIEISTRPCLNSSNYGANRANREDGIIMEN
ncbi:17889_t:CDS:2 [Funneliformis geosporum]|uniref:17889_t:CDS:1 n=1 Tax=Funneliformis geosporum TaxID=1117311 RepID=A0A9W4WNT1_9GLOM|nr:17889_t:CDS:2 [Funneliformis geosporum]